MTTLIPDRATQIPIPPRPRRSDPRPPALVRFDLPVRAMEPATFDALVEPQFPRLRRIAWQILRSDDLAEDALQEALLSLWMLDALPANVAGWLARAVVFRSLHLRRSGKRRRAHEERACLDRPEWETNRATGSVEAAELVDQVRGFLDDLPACHRAAFELREVEQLDYLSIAHRLGIPIGTVRSRLSRSRKELLRIAHRVWGADEAGRFSGTSGRGRV